jgi:arylsulfatase A-like enzyme
MDSRPNILFIMTDQQRGDCLSIAGHPVLETPNMDAIAAAGVRFSRAYTTCPSCIASRRSLMTGQFPATHGMVGYNDGLEWNAPPTLPDVLRQHGYQTGLVGRHMHTWPRRKRFGFETILDNEDYDKWLVQQTPDATPWFGGGVMHNDWTARPWHLDEPLHFTNWTVNRALEWLDHRDPSCPYFLCVSFIAPHPPLQPPAFYFERYLRQDLPAPHIGDWAQPPASGGLGDDVSNQFVDLQGERLRSARAGYYGLINQIDDQLRRLLNPVQGVSLRNNKDTIVVFTSDHGEMLGDHYHWRKQVPFEASANIPLLIHGPAALGLQRRSVVDAPVALEDLMPTLLDMTDTPIPDSVEGQSMLPLMRGEPIDWREDLHIQHSPEYQAITNGRDKFVWYSNAGTELYFDLTTDPHELRNRVSDPDCADRVAQLRARLIQFLDGRPEGFVEDGKLVAGKPFAAALPHVHGAPA